LEGFGNAYNTTLYDQAPEQASTALLFKLLGGSHEQVLHGQTLKGCHCVQNMTHIVAKIIFLQEKYFVISQRE